MENLSQQVHSLMMDCLFKPQEIVDGKPPENHILVDGILGQFALHPERTKNNKDKIKDILNQMPEAFHVGKGGGMSFLNLCETKDGEHWAEHSTMNSLVVLGIATEQAAYCIPREMWSALPGGMPYVMFLTEDDDALLPS